MALYSNIFRQTMNELNGGQTAFSQSYNSNLRMYARQWLGWSVVITTKNENTIF